MQRRKFVATPRVVCHITTVPESLVFLKGQARFMRESGFDLQAISSPGQDLTTFGERESVQVSGIPMTRAISPIRDLVSLVRLVRALLRIKPVIVHTHTPKGGLLGLIAGTAVRAPIRLYHLRGLRLMGAAGWRRRLLLFTERLSCALADEVIAVSHSLRQAAIDEGICDPDKIVVLAAGSGQGVDAQTRFNPNQHETAARDALRATVGIPPDALVVGFVGRLAKDKGIAELTAAWSAIRGTFSNAHLLLVGGIEQHDPPPAATLDSLTKDTRVHRVGSTNDTAPYYAAMDVFILPTYREGFPNVVLEASAMSLPVIATDVVGCVDAVIPGRTGCLVPPRDPEALADALATYLADKELRAGHGQAGREMVTRTFAPQRIFESLLRLYQDHIQRQFGSTPTARGIRA